MVAAPSSDPSAHLQHTVCAQVSPGEVIARDALEQSLWVALQTLQQRAVILASYEEQARELRSHATRLRTVLADLADESPGATSVELSTGDE